MKQDTSTVVTLLIGMSLQACIIYYLNNLQTIGCECAMNSKRTFIFGYTIFSLLFGIPQLFSKDLTNYLAKYPAALVGILVLAISNIVITLLYIEDIKKANCKCSESVFRDMMYYLAIINACLYALGGLMALYGVYILHKLMSALKK
jgi:hypothetical protein